MSIRSATHAGTWYSDNPTTLNNSLEGWINDANAVQPKDEAKLPNYRAIISPHAGYSYSGPTAAFGFSCIPSTVKRVFILGPSHHVYLDNCALSQTVAYETPLGSLKIDTEVNQMLRETGLFSEMSVDVDEDEHSIEMQLPYIAKVLQGLDITIVPVLVGNLSVAKEKEYGEVFAPFLENQENFFVISSDFCHWGARFSYQHYDKSQGAIHESIAALDKLGMEYIERKDADGFASYLKQFGNTICGRHPIAVLLRAIIRCDKNHSIQFAHYAQSSPCKRMSDSSVSYAAAIVEQQPA